MKIVILFYTEIFYFILCLDYTHIKAFFWLLIPLIVYKSRLHRIEFIHLLYSVESE